MFEGMFRGLAVAAIIVLGVPAISTVGLLVLCEGLSAAVRVATAMVGAML